MTLEKTLKQFRKILNWKTSFENVVQGSWLKQLTNIHGRTARWLSNTLEGEDQTPV